MHRRVRGVRTCVCIEYKHGTFDHCSERRQLQLQLGNAGWRKKDRRRYRSENIFTQLLSSVLPTLYPLPLLSSASVKQGSLIRVGKRHLPPAVCIWSCICIGIYLRAHRNLVLSLGDRTLVPLMVICNLPCSDKDRDNCIQLYIIVWSGCLLKQFQHEYSEFNKRCRRSNRLAPAAVYVFSALKHWFTDDYCDTEYNYGTYALVYS